jgi:hypothetical protein
MSRKKYRTDFLYPTNGFLIGVGNVLNLAGNYYSFNYSSTDEEADSKAIESDWGMIGQDIHKVYDTTPCNKMQIA